MVEISPPRPRRPNPVTQAAFRRQVWREVYLPLGLTTLGLVILVVAAAFAAWGSASSWADVVVVVLAIPLAIALIVMLAVLVAGSVLLIRLVQTIPEYTVSLQDGLNRLSSGVRQGSDAAARVAIIPSALAEAVSEVGRAIRAVFRSG